MFFVGEDDEWESRTIKVPSVAGGRVVACYQTVKETGTADCFYVGHAADGSEIAGVRHVILQPEDVVI
jgi:hypothetical protein